MGIFVKYLTVAYLTDLVRGVHGHGSAYGRRMAPDEMLDYCLAKPGAYLDHPFDPEHSAVRLKTPTMDKGRIFAEVFVLRGVETVTLRSEPDVALTYRDMYPGIVVRGYHCPPAEARYANTMPLDGAVPDDHLREMADEAYEFIVGKLPRYRRAELGGLGAG